MAKDGELEWKINCPDRTSKILEPQGEVSNSVAFSTKISSSFQKASKFVMSDANRIIHCFKVGVALCLVSLFYYMRPLYDGVGGNAMWAVITAVIAFEYTVGATICKCLNRGAATALAGALGIGVHWVASQSGANFEPIILQASVFLLAVSATFSRFVPSVKAQFDHGALIFILTFILVSVSGYRVGELFEMANHRLSTVGIGTSICIIISMFFCPIWAGNELHNLVKKNMADLADSLDGCVEKYFVTDATKANGTENEASKGVLLGYTCVLNSRATEESLINFARWEPAHGDFNFRHPWKEYLLVGDLLRSFACSLDSLHGIIITDTKTPDFLKKHFSKICIKLSSNSSAVLKELVIVTSTMGKTPKIDLRVEEMLDAVEEVQIALKALSKQPNGSKSEDSSEGKGDQNPNPNPNASPTTIAFVELIPLVTLSSLLIEIAARTEKIVNAVNELAAKTSSEM